MRILQVLPALVSGGVERGTVEIATALRMEDHPAWVASSGGPLVADLEDRGVVHHRLPLATKPAKRWAQIGAWLGPGP